jgi:uncharacterized membrane protein (DUF2068 family)
MERKKRDVAHFSKKNLRAFLQKANEVTHQKDFGVRLIITLKLIKGSVLFLAGIAALALLGENLGNVVRQIAEIVHVDPNGKYAEWLAAKAAGVDQQTLAIVGVGSFFYSGVMFLEAIGLHYRYTWAATLTIVATSLLIPVEIYHVIEHISFMKFLILCINVGMVLYLYSHRSLFHPTKLEQKIREKFQQKRAEHRRRIVDS